MVTTITVFFCPSPHRLIMLALFRLSASNISELQSGHYTLRPRENPRTGLFVCECICASHCRALQLQTGKFPFPVQVEYTLAARNLPQSARTRVECLHVHGKTFPSVLLRYAPASVRRLFRNHQFYMQQYYRDDDGNSRGAWCAG